MTVAMLTIGGKGKVTGDYSYIYFFFMKYAYAFSYFHGRKCQNTMNIKNDEDTS